MKSWYCSLDKDNTHCRMLGRLKKSYITNLWLHNTIFIFILISNLTFCFRKQIQLLEKTEKLGRKKRNNFPISTFLACFTSFSYLEFEPLKLRTSFVSKEFGGRAKEKRKSGWNAAGKIGEVRKNWDPSKFWGISGEDIKERGCLVL